jgi:hypothetical protein
MLLEKDRIRRFDRPVGDDHENGKADSEFHARRAFSAANMGLQRSMIGCKHYTDCLESPERPSGKSRLRTSFPRKDACVEALFLNK